MLQWSESTLLYEHADVACLWILFWSFFSTHDKNIYKGSSTSWFLFHFNYGAVHLKIIFVALILKAIRWNNEHFVDSSLGPHLTLRRQIIALDNSNISSTKSFRNVLDTLLMNYVNKYGCVDFRFNIYLSAGQRGADKDEAPARGGRWVSATQSGCPWIRKSAISNPDHLVQGWK